jgi:hypothetical protein
LDPKFLTSALDEVTGYLHALANISLWKKPWFLMDRQLDALHSQSGCCEEEKNLSRGGN